MNKICAFGDSVMKGIVEDCSRVAGSVKYMISNLSFAEICSSRLGLDKTVDLLEEYIKSRMGE